MRGVSLLFLVCWPALLALGLLLRPLRRPSRALASYAALPALLAPLADSPEVGVAWLMLGARLGLDPTATVLLPATAALWLAAGMVARAYLTAGPRRDLFFVWFLAAMTGNLLLLVALDTVVFYLGFALMSFASYGLVVHEGDARARHAGRYYISLVVIGEVCIISALMLLASKGPIDFASLRAALAGSAGPHTDLVIGLLVAGFGIKAGVFGLHFWLPLAHPVAPAPASAVLSGAMIKAGLVAWMRLLPVGEAALPGWGATLAALGMLTAFYGVLAGLPQREPKTVLAYSSVSQMGLMTFAIGLGLAWPEHWPKLYAALLIYMVHHGLCKGVLFIGAGLVRHPLQPSSARLTAVVLVLAALALAGAPWTGGLVAKLALKHGAALAQPPWGGWLPMLLTASSVLTGLLMLRFLALAWPQSVAGGDRLSQGVMVPLCLLLTAALVAPWWLADEALGSEAAGLAAAAGGALPALVAMALAAVAVWLRRARRVADWPRVPPGDLGIGLERGVIWLGRRLGHAASEALPAARGAAGSLAMRLLRSGPAWAGRLGLAEARLAAWSVTGLLLLLLAAAFALLLT
jgi:formate hydrogenlyase subunit 3/multisubunit Na+/H+ antiporter MnhD subunit